MGFGELTTHGPQFLRTGQLSEATDASETETTAAGTTGSYVSGFTAKDLFGGRVRGDAVVTLREGSEDECVVAGARLGCARVACALSKARGRRRPGAAPPELIRASRRSGDEAAARVVATGNP